MTEGVVEFPDGRRIRGRGIHEHPSTRQDPEFGLYLLAKPPPAFNWDHHWLQWPDFRLPRDTRATIWSLRDALERASSERVEIACGGGVGRTGTAMAVLAIMSGIPGDEAVAWVRSHYRPHAIETPWQKRWIRKVHEYPA